MTVPEVYGHESPKVPEPPHVCLEGVVYLGHLVEHPDTGDEVEAFAAYPCSRCQPVQNA